MEMLNPETYLLRISGVSAMTEVTATRMLLINLKECFIVRINEWLRTSF